MLPLLYSILDYDRSPASFERYDKMSAWDLFQRSVTRMCGLPLTLWHALLCSVCEQRLCKACVIFDFMTGRGQMLLVMLESCVH